MADDDEREVPELPDLVTEIDATIAQLNQPGAAGRDPITEIRETVLPLLRDLATSVMFALEDLQDQVSPVELTGAEAQEGIQLLKAFVQLQPGNTHLQERVTQMIDALGGEGDDESDEGDTH